MSHATTTRTTFPGTTATVIPFPGTTGPSTTRRHRVRRLLDRITRPADPRRQATPYQPRRVDVEPFEHATGDWRRMLMSVQRLT